MQLAGRRVVVTGAGGHFGKAVSRGLLDAGAHVIGFNRTALDVCDDPRRVGEVLADAMPFDGLVHAAARVERGGMCHIADIREQLAVLQTNLIGTFTVLRHTCFMWFYRRTPGSAVVLSGGGVGGPARRWIAAYAASKAGVVQLAETMGREYAESGIRVNALAPGNMPSKMNQGPRTEPDNTDDAVRCAVFLLSGAAAGMNGRLISAVRDPWLHWASTKDELHDDMFRLRRVTENV